MPSYNVPLLQKRFLTTTLQIPKPAIWLILKVMCLGIAVTPNVQQYNTWHGEVADLQRYSSFNEKITWSNLI